MIQPAPSTSSARWERWLLALLALALLTYVVHLGRASIWDANEAYYVETPREMLESGDYLNPSFNYEPRFNKPVLSYWIVAGLYHVFGISVGVQRVAIAASAFLMIGAALLLARAASGHRIAGVLGALGLAADPRFFMFARRILIDMALASLMTLVLLFFALSERYPSRRRPFLVAMYVCVGLGVLTKGPVAAVLPAIVFAAYLLAHHELPRLREMMLPAGAVIALAIAGPWYVALYLESGWTHISEFFIGENLERYTALVGPQSRGWLFYLPVVLTDSFPWSLCLPGAVIAWVRERGPHRMRPEMRIRTLLLLWIAVTVAFFSFSQTKQDLYILPIVPAVAALGGDLVARAFANGASRAVGRTFVATGLVLAILGGLVLFLFGSGDTIYAIDGTHALGAVALIGGVAAVILAMRRHVRVAVASLLAALIVANWTLLLRTLPSFERYKPVVPLSATILRQAGAGDVIAHYDVALPSMVFYLRRHIDVMFDEEPFVALMQSRRPVFAVLPEDRYTALAEALGPHACVIDRRPTSDVKLREILSRQSPPSVVLVSNRCRP